MAAAAAAAVVAEVCHRPQETDIKAAMAFLRAGLAGLPRPTTLTAPTSVPQAGGPAPVTGRRSS